VDEMPTHQYYSDSSIIDSYEVIKGPAQAFYLGAGIGGVVLATTKKPLPYSQNIATASIDEWGFQRYTVDSTGPLGKLGESVISYRLIGAYQDGKSYFNLNRNFRESIFPEFAVKYRDSSIRLYYNYEKTIAQQGMGLLTPQGKLYTGAGWKNSDNRTQDYAPAWEMKNITGEWLQKLSDNWETRVTGTFWHQKVYGKYFSPTAANFDNQTETWINRLADERFDYWTMLADAQGHYTLGSSDYEVPNRDNFGFNFSDWTDKQSYWQTLPFPYPNGPVGGKEVIPFGQTAGTPLGGASSFPPPPTGTTYGAYNTVIQDSIYWQHEADIIPNWLTLTAAFTWANIDTEAVPNWGTVPYVATHTPGQQWVHRLGAVGHLTKQLSVYALESTNFATPLGSLLENGGLAPNQVGTGTEVGIKWNLLGGRLSGESAWFKTVTTNSLNTVAGLLPNGLNYAAVIGTTTLEGIDGDVSFLITPSWQLIGAWYAGHDVDPNNNPVALSWNNTLGIFTRYTFGHDSALNGLAFGGGMNRLGGRWVTPSGVLTDTATGVPNFIKLQTGTDVTAFVEYKITKHWAVTVRVDNILNEAYVVNYQTPVFADPSMPATFSFELTYKY